MRSQAVKNTASKFPLRLLPSVRRGAETYAAQEGVSLNQFINVAVAERLAQMRHESWLRNRAKVTEASIERALAILDLAGDRPPDAGDELPEGYRTARRRRSTKPAQA